MWSISSCIGFKNPILSNWSSAISWVKIELRLQVGSQVHLLHFWDRTFHLYFDIFWINMEYIYIATYLSKKFDSWFCFSLQHSSKEYIYEDQFHWPHVLFSASNFQYMLLKYLSFLWWYTLICCWDTIFWNKNKMVHARNKTSFPTRPDKELKSFLSVPWWPRYQIM